MRENPDFARRKRDRLSQPKVKDSRLNARRHVLGAVTALGVVMAPDDVVHGLTDVLKSAPTMERPVEGSGETREASKEAIDETKQRVLDDAIAAVQWNLQKPEVQEALHNPESVQKRGEDPISKVISAMEIPLLAKYHLENTSCDERELYQYAVQIKTPTPTQSGTSIVTAASERFGAYRPGVGYGNGVFLGGLEGQVLTNGHMTNIIRTGEWNIPSTGPDLGLYPVPEYELEKNVVRPAKYDPTLTDAEVDGKFGCVVGIDRDATADENGHKSYCGTVVKIPSAFARFLNTDPEKGPDPRLAELYEQSYMMILPPGEAKVEDKTVPLKKQSFPAKGMSGSALNIQARGAEVGYQFSGVFWAARSLTIGERTVDIGIIHGIDTVKDFLNQEEKTARVPRPRPNVGG